MEQQNNSNTTSLTTENTESTVKEPVGPVEDESSTTSNITLEDFKSALEGNLEVKGYFDSEVDKTVSKRLDKAVESWKTKNLQNIIEEEINKRYPKKTEAEIKFEEKVKELEQLQEEKRQLELKIKYQDEISKNGLDPKVLKFVAGSDIESTLSNIKEFKELLNELVENKSKQMVDELFKNNSTIPSRSERISKTTGSMWDI